MGSQEMPRGTWQNGSEIEKSRQPKQVHHGASCRQWELNPTGGFGASVEQASQDIPPVRWECPLVFGGGMLILAHLACCTPERSNLWKTEQVFSQCWQLQARLVFVEMGRAKET